MGRLLPVARQIGGAAQQVLVAIDFEGREARGGGHRMTGVGVAVEQLDGSLAGRHHVVIDGVAHQHGPHGDGAIGQPLAQVIMSGMTSNSWAAKGAPRRPKPVITSSKISRMPCLVQISRSRLR